MKKFIVIAVALALLVPSMALAAAEFSLGGFIKLDAMWDSDNGVGKNMNVFPNRNNADGPKHGRLKFTAQGSRFNFTIKGPKLWGAQVTGFMEMDFDSAEAPIDNGSFTTSNSYTPRLRHAMFRFNWPTTELLFGLYWSMFCEYYAESAEDGPLQMTGTPTARNAQVRFTQTFGPITLAGSISDPNQTRLTGSNTTAYGYATTVASAFPAINTGQLAETPQLQGKVTYAQDLWGKAAYYGTPKPFTAQVVAGWQRSVMKGGLYPGAFGGTAAQITLGEQAAVATGNIAVRTTYVNPWLLMGSLFIPVIPTHSANLAGTASILTQWWIGQGVETFGFAGAYSQNYRFRNNMFTGTLNYDVDLQSKFGGFVEGQYYFNNQWFVNALYAFSKAFNVSRSAFAPTVQNGLVGGWNGQEYAYATAAMPSTIQQATATLWYRPIQAIKFGLQYSYLAANFYQMVTTPANTSNSTDFGSNHRVEFVGFFYF
jgi:hypothetical protein